MGECGVPATTGCGYIRGTGSDPGAEPLRVIQADVNDDVGGVVCSLFAGDERDQRLGASGGQRLGLPGRSAGAFR